MRPVGVDSRMGFARIIMLENNNLGVLKSIHRESVLNASSARMRNSLGQPRWLVRTVVSRSDQKGKRAAIDCL